MWQKTKIWDASYIGVFLDRILKHEARQWAIVGGDAAEAYFNGIYQSKLRKYVV